MDPDQSASPRTNQFFQIPLFTRVTPTTSTSYTTDIRLVCAIMALAAMAVCWRGTGWESILLGLGGGAAIWKTAKKREGGEFKRVRRALRH